MSMRLKRLQRPELLTTLLLIVAAIFYFWQLGRPDIITDESSYATRSIGLVDFDFGIEQSTPWQWVDHVPWWMHMSFSDDPPLVFLLQHTSLKLFGENPFAIRFPEVIAGLVSIWLLFLIGRRLYSPWVGLASAAIFSFTVNHVWISRIGLLESMVIAFMLASVWAFLKALENPKWLLLASAFLGLAFLSKYTSLILVPFFLIILAFRRPKTFSKDESSGNPHSGFRRNLLFSRWVILAVFCFLLVVSPVIFYNIQLYRNFGHFDFQFSLLLHQDVREWQARPGQELLGSYVNRITHFIPWLVGSESPYLLIVSVLGILLLLWEHWKSRHRMHGEILLMMFLLIPYLVFIGPTPRFFALLTPWLAIIAGYFLLNFGSISSQVLKNLRTNTRYGKLIILGIFIAVEAAYAANSVIALKPKGNQPWGYSHLHLQAGSWGFNELEQYLQSELKGTAPEVAITFQFPFARDILNQAVERAREEGRDFVPVGIVYNDNINLSASLWTFLRRIVYNGWPVATATDFRNGGASKFFQVSGVKTIYFINPTNETLQDRPRTLTPDGDLLESELAAKGLKPVEIKNPQGKTAFKIYTFAL